MILLETPDEIGGEELLIRYLGKPGEIVQSNDGPIANISVFHPMTRKIVGTDFLEVFGLSVNRKLWLDEEQILELGIHVMELKNKHNQNIGSLSVVRLCGRVQFSVSILSTQDLKIRKSEPPPHHADIIGWPTPVHRKPSE